MYLVWRVLFRLVGSRFVERGVTLLLRVVLTVRGEAAVESLIARFDRLFVYSGWPIHPKGWTNIHFSAVAWRLRRRLANAAPRPGHLARRRKARRIGFVGRFSGLLFFPKELFEGIPEGLELCIFDIVHRGRPAQYLRPLAAQYVAADFDADYNGQLAMLANAINGADLDLLVNVNWRREAFDLLDVVDTPCIMNYCAGSDLLHHGRVAVQLHSQPQADYFVVRNRMYCGLTRSTLGDQYVRSIRGFYDRRGLPLDGAPEWSSRKPLIVFHGSLYKLASGPFLDVMCGIMHADSAVELAFMGAENAGALRFIASRAAAAGLSGRVHYEGQFSAIRTSEGTVEGAGWDRLLLLLGQARLAPDPWPIGGGCSRLEAYVMGVPSVHMAVRLDADALGRPQHAAVDLPAMRASLGTATTPEGYHALCLKCLYEQDYADRLRAEQLAIARDLTNVGRWWNDLDESYDAWRESVGALGDAAGKVDDRTRSRDGTLARTGTGA